MKTKVFKLTSLLILFFGLGFINELNAQGTRVTITITGEYVAGAQYAAIFRIYDLGSSSWYTNWTPNPVPLSYGLNQNVACDLDLGQDYNYPNWIVYTQVTRTGGGAPTRTQSGQSSAVTTQQYYTPNYVQITVTF